MMRGGKQVGLLDGSQRLTDWLAATRKVVGVGLLCVHIIECLFIDFSPVWLLIKLC